MTKKQQTTYDITIIGGGPAGLFTAFYAGMRNLSVNIIESLPNLGGQLSTLYPDKYIYDVAGFPKVKAQELVNNLSEQMAQFNPTVTLNEAVQEVKKQTDGSFLIKTNENIHLTKTIIITAGNGAFEPRKLKLASARQYEGKNLHYFVDDINKFKNKRVQLFGGGDSCVDWALMLEPIAKEVTIAHRRTKFRAHEHSVDSLRNSSVNILTPFVPVEFTGTNNIEQVILEEVNGQHKKVIEVDEVICNYGFVSSLGPIKDWGLNIEKNSIVVNSKMETNIEGIYAVGDICTYEGKVKLIATGFGEAPTAVSNAKIYIDPSAKMQPAHSTSIMGENEKNKALI
ncbi:NAD(P)/FAD-dependent oxidoreductase [Alteribacillus sp. YIM 98480]|uniref:NAD(P)/FAD-dependent oxidoreductase n=1 Tax=Alteribacillus sp. YIM 98480 TaxID=2606599 RepID=UPI00131AB9B7|nr:NAD(P)/FAD-dependent oxidoreductase [Alteribacillus sp. YIM 98480]